MKKKIIALCTIFMLTMSIATAVQASKQNSVKIKAEEVEGKVGEEVTMKISLENTTQNGFVSSIWEIGFNPAYLECTQAGEETILEKTYKKVHIDNENGLVRIVAIEQNANTQSGDIAILHFNIKKGNLQQTPVNVQVMELKDKEGNNLSYQITKQGNVIIQNSSQEGITKGDINKDGKVTLYDAFKILEQAILGGNTTQEQISIMDYNDDGKVTLYDAFRFLEIAILG